MPKLIFSRTDQKITLASDDNWRIKDWPCRSDFFPGHNAEGQERESLPLGGYIVSAEIANNGPGYGTCYITTGDPRGRDIHGGGSDLPDPFAARQGWEPTLGCLRMQNADGEELAALIIKAGNSVPLEVRND